MKSLTHLLLPLGAVFTILSGHVHAATIVADWGGDYTSGASTVLVLPTPVNPSSKTWTYQYSSSTAISPSSSYTPPSGKSGTFYGALEVTNTEAANAAAAWEITPRIINGGTADRIGIRSNDLVGSGTSATSGLIFFKKADFLNSMSSPTVKFDSSSAFTMTFATHVADVRLAVLDGSQWYLSSFVSTSGNISLSNLAAENFGSWNITGSSNPLPSAPGTFGTAGSTFTNIQAVGFYFTGSTNSTGVNPGVQATGFSVSAIPEPTTTAALFLAGAYVWIARARRTSRRS